MIGAAEAPPGVAPVLRTLIGMNHRASGASPAYSHQHRVEHELAVNGWSRRPADNPAREQIHDDGQVEPALPRPNVGDIGDPGLVSPRHRELPLQEVGDQDGGLADRPAPRSIAVQMWLGIRLEGWLTIAAIVCGPILALWAQRWSERRREKRTRKLWLFRELMVTRTIRLSGRHVEALNLIDLEFDPRRDITQSCGSGA